MFRFTFSMRAAIQMRMSISAPTEKNKNTVVFRVWAPDAKNVSVTGDFNDWSETENPMKPLKNSGGVWEAEIKNIKPYDMYKYCITAADGRTLMKCDPYGFHMETRPGTATKIL